LSLTVRLLPRASVDLHRLPEFLDAKSVLAGARSRQVLADAITSLRDLPNRGRPGPRAGVRELVVAFGRDAYIFRYRVGADEVVVVSIRHFRERR
jgi:plasmid stabilization system protein ParE